MVLEIYTALLVGTEIDAALLAAPKFTVLFAAAGVKFCAAFALYLRQLALRR